MHHIYKQYADSTRLERLESQVLISSMWVMHYSPVGFNVDLDDSNLVNSDSTQTRLTILW